MTVNELIKQLKALTEEQREWQVTALKTWSDGDFREVEDIDVVEYNRTIRIEAY